MKSDLNEPEKAHAEQVVTMLASLNQVTEAELRGPSQLPHLVAVRREVAETLRKAGYSTPKIGSVLNRDHTTVLYLLETAGLRATD